MKASGAVILTRARDREKAERGFVEDGIVSTLQIQDVEAEQRKYNNFWVGIQRRIEMKMSNFRTEASRIDKKQSKENPAKYIIHPLNSNKVLWDVLVCGLVIYSVVLIPLRIAFPFEKPTLGFVVFDHFINGVFFIDMGLTFNTAYLDTRQEIYIYSRPMIAKQYLKFWFWIDFISTVPIDDIVAVLATSAKHLSAVRAIRILRLGRLAKLQRINKLSEYLEEQFNIGPSLMNMVMLMLQIFFVAHVFACFWHALSGSGPITWITDFELTEDSTTTRYIAALYYTIVTMLTVGYGDIHPTNSIERGYSIVMMLSGGVIFGALLNKVATVVEQRNPQARAFKENMDELREFLEECLLPVTLKARAKEAYSYYLTKKSSFGESGIYDDLPQPLLFKLVLQLYEKDIKKVKMFSSYECSFVVTLVINSKPFQAAQGEIIFHQGDVCKDIVFLPSGMVRLSVATGSGKDVLIGFCTEGGYFGDLEFFRNSAVTLAQYSAMNSCELLSVSYLVVRQAIAENLDSGTNFNAEMTRRYTAFVKSTKSTVLGDLKPNTTRRGSVRNGRNSSSNLSKQNPSARGSFSQRRHSAATPGAHMSIWLNGHVRDHRESAHYIRMALGQSSDNLAASAHRNAIRDIPSSAQNSSEDVEKSSGSLLSMGKSTEVGDSSASCRLLMKDEDGSQLVVEVSHRALHRMLIIDPTESWKLAWDVFIAVIIVYTILMTPVEIAFMDENPPNSFEVELFLDGLFFLDLAFSFRTTFPSEVENAMVADSKMIALAYLRSWFTIDFLSSIPYSLVFGALVADERLKSVKLVKGLRLFRLIKLARIFKLEVFISKLEDTLDMPRAVFELLQVLVEVFFVGHLVACLWWGISDAMVPYPWFTNTDMVFKNMRFAPIGEKYLVALYFTFATMTTVGYGDISATNTGEMILIIMLILLGASVFGYIIANVSTIMESFGRVEAARSNRISVIKQYLGEKDCPEALERKVATHFKRLFAITSAYNVDKIMSRLPPVLRDEILLFHHMNKIQLIPIFRYIDNRSLVLHIFHLLSPVFYEVDQCIVQQGQDSGEISFIIVGTACAFLMPPKKKAAAAVKKVRPRGNGLNLLDLIDNEEQLYAQAREAFTAGEGVGTAGTINTDLPGGAASTSEGKALPATKVSFKQIIEISSPRDLERATLAEAGSPRTSSVPLPSHTPLRTRASFFSLAADDADDADEEEEEADEEKAKGPGSAKASAWSSSLDDKGEGVKEKKRGPLLIGNFHAGHFVGHAALMNDAPHDFSVVATSACTTFVLTKATLYKLIHSEAEIGIMLQEALGCAIAAQAQELGQSHRRHNRADFLRDLKEKVIDMHSKSIPVSVREKYTSASNTVAKDAMAVVNRVAFSEGDFSKDAKGLSFKKARKSAKMKPSVASIKSPSAKNKNVRSIRRYLPLLGGDNKICPIEESEQDSAAKAALPGYNSALVQRRKEVEALRKLKKLDHLLNEETVLYNSEEEEDHHAKKVQAVSHMQALVRFNQQMQLRTATETPKQKLQRLLRRALRQYRRNKTRKELIATTESLNDLVGLETHDLFHRHSLALGVGHEHQEPIQHSEPQQASMSDLLAANVGSAPPRLTIAGSLAAGPDNHQRQVEEKASRPSAIFPMRYGIHSVSFGLSAIAALHLSHKSELTRHEMAKIKRRVRRGRNWSFSALEGQVQPLSSVELQPFGELGGVLSPRDETVSHCISRQVVRKVRRQSFPSLDNETWRDAKTFFAVL